MKTPAKLVLIDGNALVHRAFHALPPLSQNGEPTNAVYGFTSILLKVVRELKPDYIIATFDLAGKTFRHDKYEKYKAHRPKTPDELITQFAKVKEVVRAFNVPIFEKEGFEADDIIGTIAEQAQKEKNIQTLIITGDLDTLQLVNKSTHVYTLKKGITDTVIYDEQAVKERFGITPSQMNDFKGLKGDPSDNIPGVPGIGEKTASSLLNEYESLEGIYENIDLIPGKIKEKLKENKEQAFLSKNLSIIKCDVPIEFHLKDSKFGGYDIKNVENAFRKFGFFTLLSRLSENNNTTNNKRTESVSANITKASRNDIVAISKQNLVAVHFENDHIVVGSEGVDAREMPISEAKTLLENKNIQKIGYDLKQLFKELYRKNIICNGLYFDILIAAYLCSPGLRNYSLEKIAFDELQEGNGEATASPKLFYALYKTLNEKLRKEGLIKLFNEIEMPLVSILGEMELKGIKIDKKKLQDLSVLLAKEIKKTSTKIYRLAGEEFNLDSPSQMSKILFEKLGIKKDGKDKKTKTGLSSTKADELEKLKEDHEIIRHILIYRELAKLKGTYTDSLLKLIDEQTGRIHTSYNQTGTATGRLSSVEPNLQNIPQRGEFAKPLREAFIAEKGYSLVSFDFSQIELRIIASLSKDKKMIAIFNSGGDVHTSTAAEINNVSLDKVTPEMRYAAKALNFGILYGMGQKGFADSSGIDMKKAKEFIDRYFEEFSGIAKFIESTKESARKYGFVQTLLGRKRWLLDINSQNWILRNAAERMAQNMPVQGLQADIIKTAMIRVNAELIKMHIKEDVRMILQIHDELVFEMKHDIIERAIPIITKAMENAFTLTVPIVVNTKKGNTLADLK